MGEFNLTQAVSVASTYVTTLNSLWSLFVVASFAAAGFGASMEDTFGWWTAAFLIVAYGTFAGAHLRVTAVTTRKLIVIADEVRARLKADPKRFTDYPRSAEAILDNSLDLRAVVAIHLTIDACVVAIILASVRGV